MIIINIFINIPKKLKKYDTKVIKNRLLLIII